MKTALAWTVVTAALSIAAAGLIAAPDPASYIAGMIGGAIAVVAFVAALVDRVLR